MPKPDLDVAALLDEDPVIQAYLEKRRADMLSVIKLHLVQLRIPLDKKSVVGALRSPEGSGRAAFLAFADADFQSMLDGVEFARAKLQSATRKTDNDHGTDISRTVFKQKPAPSLDPFAVDKKSPVRTDEDFEIERLQYEKSKRGPSR